MEVNPYQAPSAGGDSRAPPRAITLPATFDYHFGPDDMLCWCRFFYYNSPAGRRQRARVVLLSALVYLAAAFFLSVLGQTWRFAFVAFGVAIVASFMTPRWFDRRISRAYKGMLDNPLFVGSFGQHQLTLSEAGVRDTNPAGETFVKWPFVIGASREGDHIFIRMANGHAAVLNRESLAGPISFEEIAPLVGYLADQAKPATASSDG